jgi:predicted permease
VRSSFRTLHIVGEVGARVAGAAWPARGSELPRVPPALGRPRRPSHAPAGAAPVVVLSHDLWRDRFASDAGVVGRTVRVGNDRATVVGVMPEGFGFPFVQDAWTALATAGLAGERGDMISSQVIAQQNAVPVQVFGRLREGRTARELEAELMLHAARTGRDDVVASVQPLAIAFLGIPPDAWSMVSLGMASFNLVPFLLLLLIAANVALLMFARAATRESEIGVRAALGAGRARIVGQLFAEALVLGALAAGIGLAAASVGLEWAFQAIEAEMLGGSGTSGRPRIHLPFWFHASLSPTTILYAGILTLVGATLSGVVPGLKVTRSLADCLKRGTAGGGGLQFGGVWTAVIVAQVAITIPFPALLFALGDERALIEDAAIAVPVDEYLAFRVEMEPEGNPSPAQLAPERYRATVAELERRLESDPRVLAVTIADKLPRMYHPWRRIEVLEGSAELPAEDSRGHVANPASVAPDYFDALGAPVLAGRQFTSADVISGAPVVVVNSSFVDQVLGGRNAIGRHLRYVPRPGAPGVTTVESWYEIVGVVPDLGTRAGAGPQGRNGIYHPLDPAAMPVLLAVRVDGDPLAYVPRLRALAQSVDPAIEIHGPASLGDTVSGDLQLYDFWMTLVVIVCIIALVLSLAGIYAAMSFAVSRRTREIGIRVALGAHRRGIVWSIFRRPLLQVGAGVVLGGMLTTSLFATVQDGWIVAVAPYVLVMTSVALLACVVPICRALAIEPTDALRTE